MADASKHNVSNITYLDLSTLNLMQIKCIIKAMLNIIRDIHSLSNFKRNTSEFIQQMKETGQPVVLTVKYKVRRSQLQ